MKKVLLFLLALLFVLQTNLFPQSPIVQQIINSVNLDSIIYFAKELSGEVPTIINGTSQTILSRHRDQPGNALAETYIKQKLESYGLPVIIQNCNATANNVLGTQIGTEYPNRKFIICGHYDSMPEGTIAPGADDNASGTVTVIEAARILSQYSFPYTIVYALWDEEEVYPWLIGSRYYAYQAAAAGDSILGVINMDNITWDSDNDSKCIIHKPSVVYSVPLYDNMVAINEQYGIGFIIRAGYVIDYSDNSYFLYNHYDAIWLRDNYYDDYNIYNHTTYDRVQYFNNQYYLKMVKLATGTLAFLAKYLNFDILHHPVPKVIPTQAANTDISIYTSMQIGTGSSTPRMYYRTKEFGGTYGNFNEVVGTSTGGGNYSFNIPELPNGTFVEYYVAAQDENSTTVTTSPLGGGGFNPPGSIPPSNFYQFFVADLTVVWADSANNLTNWTKTGGWDTTSVKFVSPPTSFTESPYGPPPVGFARLICNIEFPILNALKTYLEFDAQWSMEYGWYYTQAEILYNGTYWYPLNGQFTYLASYPPSWGNWEPYYGGVQTTWVHEIMDISGYSVNPFKIRFTTYTDGGGSVMDGFYLDNIKITTYGVTDVEDTQQLPTEFALEQNYPNPFNPVTTVKFSIQKEVSVNLSIYNILGEQVKVLKNEVMKPGYHNVEFNATALASGVYFYRIKAGDFVQTKKMLLLK